MAILDKENEIENAFEDMNLDIESYHHWSYFRYWP